MMLFPWRFALLILALSTAGFAATINFDSLADGTALTNQFAASGVIFNAGFTTQSNVFGGTFLVPSPPEYATVSGNPSFIFSLGGVNTVTDFVSFDNPGLTSSGSFLTGAMVQALDLSGNVLGSMTVPPVGPNQARPISTTRFNVAGIHAISFTRIANPAGGALLAIDNVTFDAPVLPAAVPEPASVWMLAVGIAGVAVKRRLG